MQEEIVFAGFGGQGVMFAGQLLAYTAMDEGYEVTWIPSYGPEMRGGTAHCIVTISDQPIGSPLVKNPKIAVVFNKPSFDKYDALVAPGGMLVVNSSLISESTSRTDITEIRVSATEMADTLGNQRMANMILLGALLAAATPLEPDQLKKGLDHHIPAHHRGTLPANYEAVDAGAAAVTA